MGYGRRTTAYSRDLAYIHHIGFGAFAREAAPALLAWLRKAGLGGGTVLDLGCGSGIWAAEMARAGYRVHGFDLSPEMIRLARRNAPDARFQVGSLFRAKLPKCAAVTCIGECVNYAIDPRGGPDALSALFRRVYRALEPGGLFVFDFAEPGQRQAGLTGRAFFEGAGWTVLRDAWEEDGGRLVRHIVSFRKVGRLYRRSEERHELTLYRAADLAAELRRLGFRVRLLRGYGERRLPAAHAVLLARKPR